MSDDVAIVSGGSGTIGSAICRALSRTGTSVLVGYGTNAAGAERVADACTGGAAEPIPLDVTSGEDVSAAVARAEDLGRLGTVVHAAGVSEDGLLLRLDREQWERTLSVNLTGMYELSRAALRPMLRARSGRIVAVTSIVGLRGNAGQTAYAAAKAGLVGFTKALAREVAAKGVTVNAVAPGYVESPMTATLPDGARERYVDDSPLGRAVDPDEVAAAVSYLVSEEAAAVTGSVLPVDGGAAI